MHGSIKFSLLAAHIKDARVSPEDVMEAINHLKNGKSDGLGLFSEHLKHACPVIVNDLSLFFTACFRHSYLPKCIRDCVIVPVPKPEKDASCSQNYRPLLWLPLLVRCWNILFFYNINTFFEAVIYSVALKLNHPLLYALLL